MRIADDGWCVYGLGGVCLAAAPPAPRFTLDETWGGGQVCPTPLAQVLALHDGLGPVGVARSPFGTPRLLPVEDLAPLTRWMRFGEENILYRPASWLRFTVDMEGGWCVSDAGEVRHWCALEHTLGPATSWAEVWSDLVAGWRLG